MVKTVNMRVFDGLAPAFERVCKGVALHMKNKYNLDEVIVPSTMASQIVAAKIMGKKYLNFEIEKRGHKKGVLKLL